ncbi:hypothetical protein GN956_G1186 [Arapaima gigas]
MGFRTLRSRLGLAGPFPFRRHSEGSSDCRTRIPLDAIRSQSSRSHDCAECFLVHNASGDPTETVTKDADPAEYPSCSANTQQEHGLFPTHKRGSCRVVNFIDASVISEHQLHTPHMQCSFSTKFYKCNMSDFRGS